jgi:hypothetical protein
LPGFDCLALTLPQPRQAHRRTQFQRLRLLLLRNGNRFEKTRFCFGLRAGIFGLRTCGLQTVKLIDP